jgi:hypothetical protein
VNQAVVPKAAQIKQSHSALSGAAVCLAADGGPTSGTWIMMQTSTASREPCREHPGTWASRASQPQISLYPDTQLYFAIFANKYQEF